jgi:hypothetical protein
MQRSNSFRNKQGRALKSVAATAMAAGCLMLASATSPLPANAQGYSYFPWALGSSLLYPLRYLGYSAYGGSGYNNPMWMGGNILNQATRGYGGMGYNGYSPYGNPNFATVNNGSLVGNTNPNVTRYGGFVPQNSNGAPAGANVTGAAAAGAGTGAGTGAGAGAGAFGATGANNSGLPGVDPSTGNYSNSNYPAAGQGAPVVGQPYAQNQSVFVPGAPSYNPYGTPNRANAFGGGSQNTGAVTRHSKNRKGSKNSNPNANASSTQANNGSQGGSLGSAGAGAASGSAPFAMAFINNVNSDYNGDIRKALANSSTRAWAQSLGISVKNNAPISDDRAGTIERILKDGGLDPVSKLNTVKILMGN